MRLLAGLIPVFWCLSLPLFAQSAPEKLEARVDSRVELMSTIFRIIGANEYNQPLSKSPYSKDVDAHFKAFRDHPVILAASKLRKKYGISYDAVMSMALHIEDTKTLKEKIPFDQAPPRLNKRWPLEASRDFLEKARDYVEQTGFNAFFKEHEPLFKAASERMTQKLNERAYLDWFDEFFGTRPGAKFCVIVGMLNGPCNYGSGLKYPDGMEEITPILGASLFDDEGIPVFTDSIEPTVVHEFCHNYTNPFVDRYADPLSAAGRRIFNTCRNVMKRQAYGNWQTMMYETLVRTCVVRYFQAKEGEKAANKEIERQHQRGFKWVGEFSGVLAEYESNRDRYPDFESFMPEVVKFFNEYAERCEDLAAQAPKVVSMIPPNNATDVDPNLTEIKVFFDRPMIDGCWAVVGDGPDFPERAGDCFYDEERKVFTMPVKLKQDWEYCFRLNYGQYDSFKSQEGVPLESVFVTFKTRKK